MGQQTTMNAHDFENHVLKRLGALRPGWTVKKGPEPFQLTIRRVRQGDLRFNLDTFYQQYREQPGLLDRLFAARLRRLDQECDSEALFGAPLILPVLRPASFLESAGGPVVGVPERGSLIAAGERAQLLGRLRHDIQERHKEAAFPVSQHLFCVADGKIRLYSR